MKRITALTISSFAAYSAFPLQLARTNLPHRNVSRFATVAVFSAVSCFGVARRDADEAHGDRGAVSPAEHVQTGARAQDLPYLLGKLAVTRPDQVWAMDITYIPMARGFVYLAAVVDWFSRRVLAWRLSITMEAAFCVEALEEALSRYGTPEIFNTDQGSQFTSAEFTGALLAKGSGLDKNAHRLFVTCASPTCSWHAAICCDKARSLS